MQITLSMVGQELVRIGEFIVTAFVHSWPLLAISIPLAALIKLSSLSTHMQRLLSVRPVLAVLMATFLGAFSPLCSFTVIPVIFTLLTAGVPLAPVMAFWLASPSMDPEIFFLSVSSLGWPLALARILAATAMSLAGGFVTLGLDRMGFFKEGALRVRTKTPSTTPASTCASAQTSCPGSGKVLPFWPRLGGELASTGLFVGKFMVLAWFLEALISFYLPAAWIQSSLGTGSIWAVPAATMAGIPLYTSNAQALGLIGGLLAKGLDQGAALAFLIGGATTTLAAMSAVYSIAQRRVFLVYLAVAVFGSLGAGLTWGFLAP